MGIKNFYQNHKTGIFFVAGFIIGPALLIGAASIFLVSVTPKGELSWGYQPKIKTYCTDYCQDFTKDDRKGTYYLDFDVIDFNATESSISELITKYGSNPHVEEAKVYVGDTSYSDINSATITAEVPFSSATEFVREIRKFATPPNSVYDDSLVVEGEPDLVDKCNEYISNIQWYADVELIDLFVLNNQDKAQLDEDTLRIAVDDLSSAREKAGDIDSQLNDLYNDLGILKISIYIQEIPPEQAG